MINATSDNGSVTPAGDPASRRNATAIAGLVMAIATGSEASRLAAIGQLVALGYTAHERANIERTAVQYVDTALRSSGPSETMG